MSAGRPLPGSFSVDLVAGDWIRVAVTMVTSIGTLMVLTGLGIGAAG